MKKNFLFLFPLGLLCAALGGCASDRAGSQFSNLAPAGSAGAAVAFTNVASAERPMELTRPPETPFTLGPGDRLAIEVIGRPETRAETFVGPDGKIYFNLLGGQDVWGLTLDQTRERLETAVGKYFSNPQVSVTLREVGSKQIWVLGRLNRPGVYPLNGPMTLLESIALAGGASRASTQVSTEELADLRHSFVMRQGQMLPVDFYRLLHEGDTSQNVYLEPDDFVYVPSALSQEVYVMGAVRFPRTVPYSEHMTLMTALAGAAGPARVEWLAPSSYGILPDAYMSHVAVVRGSLSEPSVAVVDAAAILKGKALDVPLEPGDIVFVPNVPYTTLKRYVNMVVNTFITTVAANEGIHAGGGQTLGVSVPVGH